MIDQAGRRYLDSMQGWAVNSLCHLPRVLEILTRHGFLEEARGLLPSLGQRCEIAGSVVENMRGGASAQLTATRYSPVLACIMVSRAEVDAMIRVVLDGLCSVHPDVMQS